MIAVACGLNSFDGFGALALIVIVISLITVVVKKISEHKRRRISSVKKPLSPQTSKTYQKTYVGVDNMKIKKYWDNDKDYYQSSGTEKLSKVVCASCGIDLHLVPLDKIVTLCGEKYCDICAERIAKEEKEKFAIMHTKCAVCGTDHPRSAMYFVNDRHICEECFKKEYPDDPML